MSSAASGRDAAARFGEVRSALQGAPSTTRWWQLVEALEGADEVELEDQLIPYIARALKDWPQALCSCPGAWWARGAEGPWPALELVTSVIARAGGPDPAQVFLNNPMRALEHLTLRVEDATATLLALAERQHPLRTLRLHESHMSQEAWRAWLATPHPDLQELEVRAGSQRPRPGTRGLETLVQLARMPALHTLRWLSQNAGYTAVEALATWPDLPGIRTLALDSNRVRRWGVEALAKAPGQHIESLSLNDAALDDEGALALIIHPGFAPLRQLNIANNPLTRAGVRALERPEITRLNELDLSGLHGLRTFTTYRPATLITL